MTEDNTLGSLFEEPDPEDLRQKCTEWWYWNDKTTLGKMRVTRDGYGRFVEFHDYTPYVIQGEQTDRMKRLRKNSLGELFG